MAWANDIDPTEPGDNDDISLGDDQIRTLKAAINERLETVFDGWPDDDPLVLTDDFEQTTLATGSKGGRPNVPETDFYYATDTEQLFIANEDDPQEWEEIGGSLGVGTSENAPAAPTEVLKAFYKTDEGILMLSDGESPEAWVEYDLSGLDTEGTLFFFEDVAQENLTDESSVFSVADETTYQVTMLSEVEADQYALKQVRLKVTEDGEAEHRRWSIGTVITTDMVLQNELGTLEYGLLRVNLEPNASDSTKVDWVVTVYINVIDGSTRDVVHEIILDLWKEYE